MDHKVTHSLVQTLRGIPDFAGLDEHTLLTIVGESMNLAWKAGSIIFREGDHGEALYVMLDGECSIHEGISPSGREVSHPRQGDSFGEMSLLLNATHSKTATAISDCEILVLPKQSFTNLLASNTALAAHFEEVLRTRRRQIRQTVGVPRQC